MRREHDVDRRSMAHKESGDHKGEGGLRERILCETTSVLLSGRDDDLYM